MRGVAALVSLLLVASVLAPATAAHRNATGTEDHGPFDHHELPEQAAAAGAPTSLPGQGPGSAGPACLDVDERFQGTATGVPDETVSTGTAEGTAHELTIDPEGCRIASLVVTLTSSDPMADFDLGVLYEDILVGSSAQASTNESVAIEAPPKGDYAFVVEPWLTVEAPYTLKVHADLEVETPARGDNRDTPFVVIAVVDTGINPYHDEFRGDLYPTNTDADDGNDVNFSEHPSRYIEGFPKEAQTLEVSLDAANYSQAVDQDNWSAVQENQLYWIPGTKIIGAYDGGRSLDSGHNVLDEHGHGTASAAVAAGNSVGSCDRCLLVAVEGTGGLEWALSQPWIDLVSNSWGNRGNVGIPTAGQAGVDTFDLLGTDTASETRSAVARGQTVLFAAGNGMANAFATPETTYTSPYTGPDWVMTVGATWKHGGEEYCHCPEDESIIVTSGKPVDVSSFAVGDIPAAPHDSMHGADQHSGTSAATPIVAGHMGTVLLHARQALGDTVGGNDDGIVAKGEPTGSGLLADGEFTRAELENVTKRAAEHTQSAWIGFFPPSPPTLFTPESELWTQWGAEGWGVVTGRTTAKAIAMVDGDLDIPERSMDEQLAALDTANREALWGPAIQE